MMEKTISEDIVSFISELTIDKIPSRVLDKTKDLILDTIGICISSSELNFGKKAFNLISSWGGKPESYIIGSKLKVPAQNAAFLNGILAHGQDYDDTHTESVVHPSACLVPVALSVGEKVDASGEEVIVALIGGLEVMIRIGMPALNRFHLRGFHTTSICGTFASSLVASKLMGLDKEKMVQSLGISGSFASGLLECIPSGSEAKRLHAGWAGFCGIVAAQLADIGYTGPKTVFEGRLGLYNSFLRSECIDLKIILREIGFDWEILNIRPKLYPCCHYLQSYLDCASYIRKNYSVLPEEISHIECKVAPGAVNIICEPWKKKIAPKTSYDARFSLPFAVSIMFAKGRASSEEFSEKYIEDKEIKDLMASTHYEIEPSYQAKDMPGYLAVTLKTGEKYEYYIPEVKGDAKNPITRKEMIEKFERNTEVLDGRKRKEIAEMIFEIEKLSSIISLMDNLLIN